MRILLPLLIISFMLACHTQNSQWDPAAVEKAIGDRGSDIVWALNEGNIDTLIRDFWHSEDALFMIDGITVRGYDAIEKIFYAIPDRRKKLDLVVDSESVMALSPDVGIHIVEFHETITHLNDSISTGQGAWTATYQKIDGDWKVVCVHESHLAQ